MASESPRKKMTVQNKGNYNQKEIDNIFYYPYSRPTKMAVKQSPINNDPT